MEPKPLLPIVFDSLQVAVERILTVHHNTTVTVTGAALLTEPGRRNRIWRCQLMAAANSVPQTVIVKQADPEGYEPSNPQAWATWRLFKDWAGAEFLNKVAGQEAHGPAFYGGEVDLGLIVLEDLGTHTSLVEPLLASDSVTAIEALMAFATRLGRMHASTIGKQYVYKEIQNGISPAWAESEVKPSDIYRRESEDHVDEFVEICGRLDVSPQEQAKAEFRSALERLSAPGLFNAFIHCDPCPDNTFYRAPSLRLIDFEFAGFGHALTDGLYGRLPFPTCWCANSISADVVQMMEDTYRKELSTACPEILDDRRFNLEACAVTANWAFTSMKWAVESLWDNDSEWGIASCRARVLTRIGVFLNTSESAGHVPALFDVYRSVLAKMADRWPDASPLPVYPAFRG